MSDQKKPLKVGVKAGASDPPFKYSVGIIDRVFKEAKKALNEAQYQHMVLQVKELARHEDPTHSQTLDIKPVGEIHELRDSGGVLNGVNVRLFYGVDKDNNCLIVLGLCKKQNNGKTPEGVKKTVSRRWRKYKAGDYGKLPLNN